MEFGPGASLAGYHIERRLGGGGMGAVDGTEEVLVTDFGIARSMGETASLTSAGSVLGTLAYAAPEQLEGAPLDVRTDVYALGGTLYELLTGFVPFQRESPAAWISAHLIEPPPRPSAGNPALPPAMDAVIARAMAKNPGDRFASCGALADAAAVVAGVTAFAVLTAEDRAVTGNSGGPTTSAAAQIGAVPDSPTAATVLRPWLDDLLVGDMSALIRKCWTQSPAEIPRMYGDVAQITDAVRRPGTLGQFGPYWQNDSTVTVSAPVTSADGATQAVDLTLDHAANGFCVSASTPSAERTTRSELRHIGFRYARRIGGALCCPAGSARRLSCRGRVEWGAAVPHNGKV